MRRFAAALAIFMLAAGAESAVAGRIFGDIKLDGKPTARTFQKRSFHFGCEWLSVEVIVPDGANRYFYSYDEEKLWCADGAPESIATPRTGYAVVVDEQQR